MGTPGPLHLSDDALDGLDGAVYAGAVDLAAIDLAQIASLAPSIPGYCDEEFVHVTPFSTVGTVWTVADSDNQPEEVEG